MDETVKVAIVAATDQLEKGLQQSTAKLQGYSKDLTAAFAAYNRAAVDASSSAATSMNNAANAAEGLKFGTAGAAREFIVLGHEVVSGNFSRIPGSLMVLAERTGNLQSIVQSITPATLGWVAAIGATVVGIYEWVEGNIQLEDTLRRVQSSMQIAGQGALFNAQQQQALITTLRVMADASKETANTIVTQFSQISDMSQLMKARLVSMVADFSAATGKDAPKAAAELIKLFEDPVKASEQLRHSILQLSATQEEEINTAIRSGDTEKAQGILFDALAAKIDNTRNNVSDLTRTLNEMHATWATMGDSGIFSAKRSEFMPTQAIRENIEGLFTVFSSGQAAAQDKQRQLNDAMQRGNEVASHSGLFIERQNELLGKKATLIKAANAAEEIGDTGAAKRFLADAHEVQTQINNLRTTGAKQDIAAEMSAYQTKIQLAREDMSQRREFLDAEVAAGKITKTQEINDLKQFYDVKYEMQLQDLEDESRIKGLSVVESQRINNQILQLEQKHKTDMLKLNTELAQEQKKTFDKVFGGMRGAFDGMVQGILQGTQTWKQAMGNLFTNLATKFIEDLVIEPALKWAESQAEQLLLKETTNTAMIASDQAAAVAGQAAQSVRAVANVTSDAAVSAAGAYSATAVIPVIGPELAPAAAAQAYAATMAFAPQASLDVGAWNLNSDMVAQLHQGEMVVPKTFAEGLRQGNGVGDSGMGGGGDTYHFSFPIQAIDTQNGAQFLKDNAPVIAKIMAGEMRKFNPNLKPR